MTAIPDDQTYGDYLSLPQLLGAQKPHSDVHDEMLFIVLHQTMELWLKQILFEIDYACAELRADRFLFVHKALSRVSRIQTVMTMSWDILSTLTPSDYMKFRHHFGSASGFQSAQFRAVEYRLGIKDPRFLKNYAPGSGEHELLTAALEAPSVYDEANAALGRAGFDVADADAIRASWKAVYEDTQRHAPLYGLAEKLVDLDDALASWRHKHVLTVERVIGGRKGTGGSAGAAYLRSTLDKRAFPALWELRTEL
ncbi:tryptophan 2,3-dioxygenase [Sphingomicrobium astaxanthinifaciens]|uniref:tryptophan 2,3-dioxygenase n=1 Tax=Sphingomicrobium astaxanthinifaciens TaxID=1227949 RepID=UPI001FCAE07B|nr:tryptophan 2,3-dioxygenase family protein [Sphingomicrobium astaxanthinifaciens]MCJ7421126.1 tryptophan 2,3-dioxygenase family protein [Sphingomicrobium astaxanthinifaciens]